MQQTLSSIRNTRHFLLQIVEGLTAEQLNHIPAGFNNNIIWNMGHLVAAMQGLCYLRSGNTPFADETFIGLYKSGTKPTGIVDQAGIDEIKALLLASVDQLEADYAAGKFVNYEKFQTRYGVEIASIDDAISFLLYHEGLHTGYISAQKRLATS